MTISKLTHYKQTQFSRLDGDILAGNRSIKNWKNVLNHTPFYIYDRQVITSNVTDLRKHLPNQIRIHYAIKANPNPSVVAFLNKLVDGVDVASHKELLLALNSGYHFSDISIAGPGKSATELKAAIVTGIILHIESQNELNRAVQVGRALGIKPHIVFRINPDYQFKSAGVRMGGGSKPFGIDESEIISILKYFPKEDADFKGFHIYSASQVLNAEYLNTSYDYIFNLLTKFTPYLPSPIEHLNLGGGFGIPYFPGESKLDLHSIGKHLNKLLVTYAHLIKNTSIIMEFGRYIIGNAGLYVTEIVDKKISFSKTFIIVNGGLHHNLANSGNFGQVIRKNYYLEGILYQKESGEHETVTICGPLCTPLDILGENISLPLLKIGDLIVVFNSGAYGLSASPQNFLGQTTAMEILA